MTDLSESRPFADRVVCGDRHCIDSGTPLADLECAHGAMAHDQRQRCTCYSAGPPAGTAIAELLALRLRSTNREEVKA
jgi:hypothetical protein